MLLGFLSQLLSQQIGLTMVQKVGHVQAPQLGSLPAMQAQNEDMLGHHKQSVVREQGTCASSNALPQLPTILLRRAITAVKGLALAWWSSGSARKEHLAAAVLQQSHQQQGTPLCLLRSADFHQGSPELATCNKESLECVLQIGQWKPNSHNMHVHYKATQSSETVHTHGHHIWQHSKLTLLGLRRSQQAHTAMTSYQVSSLFLHDSKCIRLSDIRSAWIL